MTEFPAVDSKKLYCMKDVISLRTQILEPMCFMIVKDGDDVSGSNIDDEPDNSKFKHYVQFKKKSYTKNGFEKTLIQIVDIS